MYDKNFKPKNKLLMIAAMFAVIAACVIAVPISHAKFFTSISGGGTATAAKPAFTVEYDDLTEIGGLEIESGSYNYYNFTVSNELTGELIYSQISMKYSISVRFFDVDAETPEYDIVSDVILVYEENGAETEIIKSAFSNESGYVFSEETPDVMMFAVSDKLIKKQYRLKLYGQTAGAVSMRIAATAEQID